ncbi:hypothetical protein EGR_03027 [Echinococcus granulosus]|uniref:Expressed conserved protein n=1 Tax=Echinococcus granulosus TaxID=6210 RepID=U6J7B3_ECHGR|nr:hypothetical protein EGR_03027 [Echinococcus granulosus]EUB62006.1 hypothetical protein EGR_03027 [Echinococcus granulosus]CDS19895.1 expressed conserved protein [Echinococcus granulosus]
MGRGKEAVGACFSANALLCKVVSVLLIVVSVALIIAGVVLMVKYPNKSLSFDDDWDDWHKQSENFAIGAGLLGVGIVLLLCSLITACCAFQFGLIGRLVKSRNDEEQQPTIVDQTPPSPDHSTGPYPNQAYSFQAQQTMSRPLPPSYEQAFHMATAPTPANPPPAKQ